MTVHTVNTLQIQANQLPEWQVRNEVAARYGRIELTPEAAVTIAAWFQSPGTVGNQLAAFASGSRVDAGAVLDDIAATRKTEQWLTDEDHRALDMLSTFIVAQVR